MNDSLIDILKFALPILVFSVVAVGVVLVLIRLVVGTHAARTVKRVRQVEHEVREKELKIKSQIEQHDAELMERKQALEAELQELRESAKRECARLKEQAIAEAKQERAKIIDQARKSEEKLKEQYRREMDEKAVGYAGRVFELVLGDLLSADLDARFIDEIIDALEEIEPGTVDVDSDSAVVTSARELGADQLSRLESALKKGFGDGVSITTATDENILGGVVFKLGSMEVDGSLRNRFTEAVEEVIKEAHAG
jgi:F0F1-type ATP synthase delta subunit